MSAVSVVVPTLARDAGLVAVVAAFAAQGPEEVVVVVDGPGGDPAVVAAVERVAGVRVVRLARNGGAGPARAAGVAAARSAVVLLVDDDIVPGAGFVEGHRGHHGEREDRVVVGYIPVALGRRRGRDLAARLCAASYEDAVAGWRADPGRVLEGLWAGNVSAHRSLLEAAEAVRPTVPLAYFEDLDLGLRLRAAGGVGVFDERIRGVHRYGKGTRAFVRESGARGVGAAQLERRWGAVPAGIATNAHAERPAGPRGWAIRVLTGGAGLPGAAAGFGFLVAAAGALRLWRVQEWVAGAVRMPLERRAYLAARAD